MAAIPHARRHTAPLQIPAGPADVEFSLGRRTVRLTNLHKVLWPQAGLTKQDLLLFYADMATALFPHLCDRALVMRRAPAARPDWIETCAMRYASGSFVDFPVVQDLQSLLWVVNLGCIDLNPWHATCDDVHRPDYLYFDLDPTPGAGFEQVREAALLIRDALAELEIDSYAKTSGSRGIHIYVPIIRGPTETEVWNFVKALAQAIAARHPRILTAEQRVSRRPKNRVLMDYDRYAWGRTLASVYSVRPTTLATVSTPVTWKEVERGIDPEDFRLDTIPERVSRVGDLWKPMLQRQGRLRVDRLTK